MDICDVHAYGNDKNVNYEKRADIISQISSFNKPCIIGEMGMAWDYNHMIDPRFYEGCNDVSFHNAIWSTAFTGSFGCGSNWWWFNALSINNYDRNLVELATFMKTVDFEDNNFSANKWRSSSPFQWQVDCQGHWKKLNYLLENYQLKNHSQTRAIGWFHNATWYWANLSSFYSCVSTLVPPCDDDFYNQPIPGSAMPDVKIKGLKWPFKRYHYHFYKTRGGTLNDLSSMHWRDGDKKTNAVGELNIGVKDIDLPYYPDFVYKVYRGGYDFREEAEDTTGDYALQFDTLCVNDTITIDGMYEDDESCSNSYYWDFGNNTTSILCHPSFSFQTPGDYTLYVLVTDSSGNRLDSVGMFYTAIDCSLDPNNLNKRRLKYNDGMASFVVFPNPSSDKIFIKNNNNVSFDYYIYNITNKIIYVKREVNEDIENIDISNFSQGLYLIKIVSINKAEVFKFIKQ